MNKGKGNRLLVVAKNEKNLDLLSSFLVEEGYEVEKAVSLEEFEEQIMANFPIVLGLIDISGFGEEIWNHCEVLRRQEIPFFTIFPEQSTRTEEADLDRNQRVLTKPLSKKRLSKLVKVILGDNVE